MFPTYPFCQMNFDDRDQWWHPSECGVDCTNCKMWQKGRDFALYKFALKSGLRYEVAVGIVTGEWSGSMVYILAASTLMSKFSMPPCWVVKMILKELRLMMGTSERAHSGLKGMVPKAVSRRLMLIRRAQITFLTDTLFLANNLINSTICKDRLICKSEELGLIVSLQISIFFQISLFFKFVCLLGANNRQPLELSTSRTMTALHQKWRPSL